MADLIASLGHDGRWRHVRDEPYLNWRYQNPLHEYRFLYALRDDGNLSGFLVLKRLISHGPQAAIMFVDLEALNEEVKRVLVRAAVGACGSVSITTWASTVTGQTLAELLRLNFMRVEARLTTSGTPQMLVWSLGQNEDDQPWLADGIDLLNQSSWDMRAIYSMAG